MRIFLVVSEYTYKGEGLDIVGSTGYYTSCFWRANNLLRQDGARSGATQDTSQRPFCQDRGKNE